MPHTWLRPPFFYFFFFFFSEQASGMPTMGREQLQALIAVAAVASFVVVVHFSSKLAAPTTVLGWPRDVFGLYNYNYGSLQVCSGNARPQQEHMFLSR
jgi:hypothetical protein